MVVSCISIEANKVFAPFSQREIVERVEQLALSLSRISGSCSYSKLSELFSEFESHYPPRVISYLDGYLALKKREFAKSKEALHYQLLKNAQKLRVAMINEAKKEREPAVIRALKERYTQFSGSITQMAFGVKNSVLYVNEELTRVLKMRLTLMSRLVSYEKLHVLFPKLISPLIAEVIVPSEKSDNFFTFQGEPEVNLKQLSAHFLLLPYYQKGSLFLKYCKSSKSEDPISSWGRNKNVREIKRHGMQMAEAFECILKKGYFFPDGKLQNWLLDQRENLIIADPFSFIETKHGEFLFDKESERGVSLLTSVGYQPPEKDKIKIDAFHAYILGINFYQMLTGCPVAFLAASEKEAFIKNKEIADLLSFEPPIFKTKDGLLAKALIEKLTNSNPEKRLGVSKAKNVLNALWRTNNEKYRFYRKAINATCLTSTIACLCALLVMMPKLALAFSIIALLTLTPNKGQALFSSPF